MATFAVTFGVLVTFLVSIVSIWYLYYQYCFTYWKKKKLATKQPNFPAGNLTPVFLGKENLFTHLENLYNEFKQQGLRHAGLYFFNGPVYFPIDPTIIKHIMLTDFDYFMDRGVYCNEEKVPLTTHLFCLSGNKWRQLRAKLTPTFTSGKLKTLYDSIFMRNTQALIEKLRIHAHNGDIVNTKRILQNFATDVVASSAFGIECDTLNNKNCEISRMMRELFDPPVWGLIKTALVEGMQNPGNLLKASHDNAEVEQFFKRIVNETVAYRKKNNIKRNDFLTLLMNVRETVGLSEQEIIAQAFLFFVAGLETSSTAMCYCLHELAYNPDIQQKLRDELINNFGDDYTKYTYDDIVKLPYLDKVVKEALRLYPVVGVLNRIVVKDYKVPNTDIVLERGTPVIISALGLQRDPEYFPDPLKFDPERFSENNKIVPYTNMPFGEGPRVCIGTRYGLLQTKLGVAAIISQYKVLPCEKTPKVIEFDKIAKSLLLSKTEGFFVKFTTI